MAKKNVEKPRKQKPHASSRHDVAGGKGHQTHENRENPEKDHPTGHMGYNRHENLDSIVTNSDRDGE